MNCPGCENPLRHVRSQSGIAISHCPACEGRWLPGYQYWRWLHQAGKHARGTVTADTAPPAAVTGSPACPDCELGLQAGSAGRGLRFQVQWCRQCGGLWFPSAQWSLVQPGHLREELEAVYATLWRRERKRARKPARSTPTKRPSEPSREFGEISRRKQFYPVSVDLMEYLRHYRRASDLPPIYSLMREFESSFTCCDANGEDTLWQTVSYEPTRQIELNRTLSRIYSHLKTGSPDRIEHIYIERIDYCEFGNSKPFRVRVVNEFNDNYDHFYVKVADASRIYGLELEHTLSPNRINYLVDSETLIEEHIAGIPGDVFIREYLGGDRRFSRVRVAKEFVKFNERCFIRLLGDMRSYNYVIEMTPDFEETQFRVRAIDFDQQTYEGNAKIYLPQFFKENAQVVKLCTDLLNYQTMQQYQVEERTLIARRVLVAHHRLSALVRCMSADTLSTPEKFTELREGLNAYHQHRAFDRCENMGELLRTNLEVTLGVSL